MYTHKDLEVRTIFVINCTQKKSLRVKSGELLLEDSETKQTLTKLPFQKILALFVIGHISITTPLMEQCTRHNVAIVVMKPNLRPVFHWAPGAEANYLIRAKQHGYDLADLRIAKELMSCKMSNQLSLLHKTRCKDQLTVQSIEIVDAAINQLTDIEEHSSLMGLEGIAAKHFFAAYFQQHGWTGRRPRAKTDPINACLDIGYTILFNYVESFSRMFGFDLYIGFYHRLWFKRKSLICDLMEPFRCIIDRQVRIGFNRKEFTQSDFSLKQGMYILKPEKAMHYYQQFFESLIPYKKEVFTYIRQHYRTFMQGDKTSQLPSFQI